MFFAGLGNGELTANGLHATRVCCETRANAPDRPETRRATHARDPARTASTHGKRHRAALDALVTSLDERLRPRSHTIPPGFARTPTRVPRRASRRAKALEAAGIAPQSSMTCSLSTCTGPTYAPALTTYVSERSGCPPTPAGEI